MIVERAALLRHHHARGARAHNLLRLSRRGTVAFCAWLPESTKMASQGPSASPLCLVIIDHSSPAGVCRQLTLLKGGAVSPARLKA